MNKKRISKFSRRKVIEIKSIDNWVFLALHLLIVIYLLIGGAIFSAIEQKPRIELWKNYTKAIGNFSAKFNLSVDNVRGFIQVIERYRAKGVHIDTYLDANSEITDKWTFWGSMIFSATAVSTIGYGSQVPHTVGGHAILIFYCILGCSMIALFFNLFMERVIAVLLFFQKKQQMRRIRKYFKGMQFPKEVEERIQRYKPSPQRALAAFVACGIVICSVSCAMYTTIEKWTFTESVYFSFVTFSTIGFGDYVSALKNTYAISIEVYRILNGITVTLGCCVFYAIFNILATFINKFLRACIIRAITRVLKMRMKNKKRRRVESKTEDIPSVAADIVDFEMQEINITKKSTSLRVCTKTSSAGNNVTPVRFNATLSGPLPPTDIADEDIVEEDRSYSWQEMNNVGPMSVLQNNLDK